MDRKTILIVDDSDVERTVLHGFLSSRFKIIGVSNCTDALKIFDDEELCISAIVLDIVMPEMDGYAFTKLIRKNSRLSAIPIIIATGLDDEESREKAIICGANGFITKPFNRKLLLHTILNEIKLSETSAIINQMQWDKLTGLYRREAFFSQAEKMIKNQKEGYYILSCLDIDNFKLINDQYGTKNGDDVLKYIAKCIQETAHFDECIACRYTADRFGILYPQKYVSCDAIKEFHRKIVNPDCTSRKIKIRIGQYTVNDLSLSVSAMYDRSVLAQESIKGKYDMFVAKYENYMREHLLSSQKIIGDMTEALSNNEFKIWYQPQYNHATGVMIGAEALVRWEKDGNTITPNKFIPIFEENGFIYEMDKYVWENVCKQIRQWIDEKKTPVPVSVNVSRYDIYQKDFLKKLCEIVDKYKIPTNLLRLEITESAFSDIDNVVVDITNELIDRNFVIEIDDFGSGYSSLNTLKDVPASILKLDMLFFENTKNAQRSGNIIESVVRMAKWLDMAVIAEGVSTKEQADFLLSIGCNYIQGYCYKKPMPLEQFDDLLNTSKKENKLAHIKTVESYDHSAFWDPRSLETMVFNHFSGGAFIFEVYNGKYEMLRINKEFAKTFHSNMTESEILKLEPFSKIDGEAHNQVVDAINRAYKSGNGETCEIYSTMYCKNGEGAYLRITVRRIGEVGERYLYYGYADDITTQREAEIKERKMSSQISAVMSNANGGITAVGFIDDKPEIIFSNERYYSQLGYTKEQFNNEVKGYFNTIHPNDKEWVKSEISKVLKNKSFTSLEYRCIKRDGSIIYIRGDATVTKLDGYNGDVIITVETDISEIILAKKEEEKSASKLKAIVDNISSAISVAKISNDKIRHNFFNKRYWELVGYSESEYLKKFNNDFGPIYEKDRERVIEAISESIENNQTKCFDYRIIRGDNGKIIWVRHRIITTSVVGFGKNVQLSIFDDVTEQKKAEENEIIAAEKFRILLSNVGNGVTATVLRKGHAETLFANTRFFEIFGYSKDECKNQTKLNHFSLIDINDRERVSNEILKSSKTLQPVTVEYRINRKDGKEAFIKTMVTVVNLQGIDDPVQIGIFTDITDEKITNEHNKFLNDFASEILSQPYSEKAIDKALLHILNYFKGDRAYIIEIDNERKTTSNTYEIVNKGISPQKELLQNLPYSNSDMWVKPIFNNEMLVIKDVLTLEDENLKDLLVMQNINSIVVAPLSIDGKTVGFLGIDNPRISLDKVNQMKAPCEYFSVLLNRRNIIAKMREQTKNELAVMNGVPGGFVKLKIMKDNSLKEEFFSDGYLNLVDMTRNELNEIHKNGVFAMIYPNDIPYVKNAINQLMAGETISNAMYRLRHGEKGYIWVSVFAKTHVLENGECFLNVFYSDATKIMKKQATDLELLDNLPCGAALYEYDGKNLLVKHLNRQYWELVNRTHKTYSDVSFINAVHPEDREIIKQELAAAIRQNRDFNADLRILNGNEIYKPFHISGRIVLQGNGKYLIYATYTKIPESTITFQKTMQVALATLMSSTDDKSYVKDLDLHYICASHSIIDVFGVSNEQEIIGKTDFDLFDYEQANEMAENDKEVLNTKEAITNKIERIKYYNGDVHIVSTSKYPLLDSVGNIIGLYCVSRDITDQKEKESQFELMIKTIPGGIATYLIEKDNIKTLFFNDGYYRCTEYSREDYLKITNKKPLALIFEEDRKKFMVMFNEIRASKVNAVNESIYRCHTKSGGYRWMKLACRLTILSDEQSILNVVQIDITNQMEYEQELEKREKEYEIAIEHSGTTICRYDILNHTLSVATEAANRLSVPPVIENMPEISFIKNKIGSESKGIYREFYQRIFNGEKESHAVFRRKFLSSWKWIEARATSIFDSDGKPISAIISYIDVTDQQEKEAIYKKWQQYLKNRDEELYTLFRVNLNKNEIQNSQSGNLFKNVCKGDFDISFNDFSLFFSKNFVIEKYREEFMKFLNPDTMLASYYRGIRSAKFEFQINLNNIRRWICLTVELVEYPNSTDIEAYLMYEDINEQKNAEILKQRMAERDPLTGVLNRKVFSNEVDRIVKKSQPKVKHAFLMMDIDGFKMFNDTFGHRAGDDVLIETANTLNSLLGENDLLGRLGGDEYVVFLNDVKSTKEISQKAKQMCQAVKKTYNENINLSMSIGVAIYPENGSDFETLYKNADRALYAAKDSGKNAVSFFDNDLEVLIKKSKNINQKIEIIESREVKQRVLVVDDSDAEQALLKEFLKDNYIVDQAYDGASALVRMRHFGTAISAVILDINMPGMNGIEVLEKMQNSSEMRNIPVIMVSVEDSNEIRLEAMKKGAMDYITKPFDLTSILLRINSVIFRAENERARAKNNYYQYNDETQHYRLAMKNSGITVIELDWLKGTFTYDLSIFGCLKGNYDERSLWKILRSDMVASTKTVKDIQEYINMLANDDKREKGSIIVPMKNPNDALHKFRIEIIKKSNLENANKKFILTFVDLEFGNNN